LRRIGPHPNIIALRGESPDGILLERVKNGTVANFMQKMGKTQIAQHSRWIHDATKAIVASHKVIVIRCDISASNLLLNEDLNAKLCRIGQACTGKYQIYMPRLESGLSSVKTDLFALASLIFYLITKQVLFPDLDPIEDENTITERFIRGEFPKLSDAVLNAIVQNC